MAWIFLLFALFAVSSGQVLYKAYAHSSKSKHLVTAVSCFCMAPVLNWAALQSLGVDVVYIATSLNAFLILMLSKIFLGEKINMHQVGGILLIFIGVYIYVS